MCERLASGHGPRARVCDNEARLGGESRTLRTVTALQAAYPEHTFSLVIGADLVTEVPTWFGAEELQRRVPFIVIGRTGFAGGSEIPMPAISSTTVRERLAKGLVVDDLVPRSVLDYIRARALYDTAGGKSP